MSTKNAADTILSNVPEVTTVICKNDNTKIPSKKELGNKLAKKYCKTIENEKNNILDESVDNEPIILTTEDLEKNDSNTNPLVKNSLNESSHDFNYGGNSNMRSDENDGSDEKDFWFMPEEEHVTMLNATTMYFNCIVNKNVVDQAIALLKQINKHIAMVEIEYPELKNTLLPKVVINSNGGSVVEGLRLFDAIKNNIYPVDTIVQGMSASMGVIVLFSGKRKFATKHSILLIHQISGGMSGKYSDIMDTAKYWVKLQTALSNIIKENTKAKKEDIDKFMTGESFFTAQEAVDLGLIDGIINI